MEKHFTTEYWLDDGWYIGMLKEVPGVLTHKADHYYISHLKKQGLISSASAVSQRTDLVMSRLKV
ncbi:hypothetical protein PITCH_A2310002 [uncultured Desulfobacterium sp.]|uniref:Uncharacterized protein n=1 Tax=uncultured Desulfobacterium sp. TaxID=201089 RepID=A0A445MYK4_9BACT|nr:hypothetical protein PITCH_A2310002 [uncultured Desulfobacterium sp.]